MNFKSWTKSEFFYIFGHFYPLQSLQQNYFYFSDIQSTPGSTLVHFTKKSKSKFFQSRSLYLPYPYHMYIAHIIWAILYGPYSIGYPMWPKFFVVFSYKLYRIIRWFIDTVSIISISVKDDAIRRERSSLAIRSLLLLIDLNKEITIISVDESEDVTKAISPIRNTSCSPVEFSSLSPQPGLIDPVHSAKAWLTRQIIRPAVMQLLHY